MKSRGEIYERAAEMVAAQRGRCVACYAIARVAYPKGDGRFHNKTSAAAVAKFAEYFMPWRATPYNRWFGWVNERNGDDRILALCFMACIAEDEDAPQRKRNL